jgi:superfamily II DNA or RNA helicase
VLTSCEILGEGIDIPTIGAAILLRPTKSLALYLQQVGRGLRPAPGKTHVTVLDIAGNAVVHGLPDAVHKWSLDAAPERAAGEQLGWTCPECGRLNAMSAMACSACGEPRLISKREFTIDPHAELVELRPLTRIEMLCRLPYREFLGEPRTRVEIETYRLHHEYQPGWTWHVLRAQRDALAEVV